MTTSRVTPPTLDGCAVLPPMEAAGGAERPDDGEQNNKPERKPGRRKAGKRFAVLNTFVDITADKLTRSEILVWLVLYRDTKDGIARTAQADVARRTGLNERTVRRAIGRLVSRRLLLLVRLGGLRKGPSAYRVRPADKTK